MRLRHNPGARRAARGAVLALAAAGVLASALQGWPERLYAQATEPLSPGAASSAVPEENVAAFRRITNKVLCQCGSCSFTALSCNHLNCSSAGYIRRVVRDSLAEGKSEEIILAGFVEQYGPKVLPEPPRQGFSILAWVMPFVALALGGLGVMFALTRLLRRPALAADAPPEAELSGQELEATPEMIEKYRDQIERELKNS